MLAFGAWVLTLTPRTRTSRFLAAFAMAAGAFYVPWNLLDFAGASLTVFWGIWRPYLGVVSLVGGLALLGLARELIRPYGEAARTPWRLALAVTGGLTVLPLTYDIISGRLGGLGLTLGLWASHYAFHGVWLFFFAAFLAVPVVLVWMYRNPREGDEDATRDRAVLVSVPIVLWPAFLAGWDAMTLANPTLALWMWDLHGALSIAVLLALAGVWLASGRGSSREARRTRTVALVMLGAVLLGMVQRAFVDPLYMGGTGGPLWGIVRLLTVFGLGYGILRHDVLGIEATYRWGVSKTTVAGIFIAVFFVVSEGAQELFAGFAGSEWLGILAAGALLFALAPIQRLADRIAEKAVPGADATADEGEAAETYRIALRAALRDRQLSRKEERELAELAQRLGIGAGDAMELREQVERELGGDAT